MKLLIEHTIFPVNLLCNANDIINLDKVLIGTERQRRIIGEDDFGDPVFEILPRITLTEETVRDLKSFLMTEEKGILRCSISFLRLIFSEEAKIYFSDEEINKLRKLSHYNPFSFDQKNIPSFNEKLNNEMSLFKSLITDGKFNKTCFLKPTSDLKDFRAGIIHKGQDVEHWFKENYLHALELSELLDNVVIASPIINSSMTEYRNVVYKGKILTTSQYCVNGNVITKNIEKENTKENGFMYSELLNECERLAKIYQPSDLFVMDVAKIQDDSGKETYKIIEYNCFACSGLYDCDFFKIIKELKIN